MRLGDVLQNRALSPGVSDIEVRDVQIDSRRCQPGSLFFAMPGATTTGARFVREAADRGAVAVVSPEELEAVVPVVIVGREHLHDAMVTASATVCGDPQRRLRLVGVTGTNGKTSVTTIVASVWRALGRTSEVIGTLNHERTTPAAPELYRSLAELAQRERVIDPMMAIEVSSHALDQGRVDGLKFEVAAFTNLTHEHLDYHQTMEHYYESKARLFEESRRARAVVWTDDPWGARLAGELSSSVTTVRRSDASDPRLELGATEFVWRGHRVRTGLTGAFNVDNSLLALAIVAEMGVDEREASEAMIQVGPVPGRFEVVRREGPAVIIDYAHTPDGLERLLEDVRYLAPNSRVTVVFGCGGDRDRAKRPLMGRVATSGADLTIVTSDNPRSEEPNVIIDEVLAGATPGATWAREIDRRTAIAMSLEHAGTGDVIVIAGKGHEKTQTVGSNVIEFNDRQVVGELLR